MSRERKIKIGAAGGVLLGVGLLLFVGLGFAQGSDPVPPTNWENPFRINRPGLFANPGVDGLIQEEGFSAQAVEEYSVVVIEPPATFDSSRAFGINSVGKVAGRFFNLNETSGAEEDRMAYVWHGAAGVQILPTLAGHSSAWDLNLSELVSGFSFNAEIDQHAVRWDSSEGMILDLGTLENSDGVSGRTSTAFGINGLGDVVGLSDIPNLAGDFTPFHGFIFSDESGMLDLGTLTTDYPEYQNGYSIAYGINASGEVVGIAHDSDFLFRPFIFDAVNGMQELNIDPTYTGGEWYAVAINDGGMIGGHVIAADNQSLPYYWPDQTSGPVPLDMPDGFPYGEIYAVNSAGEMVGIMWDTDADVGAVEHAFVFDAANGVRDLNSLIPVGSGWVLNFARDINDTGQIVGTGEYMGEVRGFLLRPSGVGLAPPADFDGDGDTDISVYRPSLGRWYIRNGDAFNWGLVDDIPVPADYDGDGDAEGAVYRPSNGRWYIRGESSFPWGAGGDIPLPCDYDGDGDADPTVFRPSVGRWYIRGGSTLTWGMPGDIPVPGDYDGNGTCDLAVYRPSNGRWYIRGQFNSYWGLGGDIPVPGDYDGNGDTDLAVYRPVNGRWYIFGRSSFHWGLATDIPVPGDFNGNGSYEAAVYRPSDGRWYIVGYSSVKWGLATDYPLPARDTNGDGDPYQ